MATPFGTRLILLLLALLASPLCAEGYVEDSRAEARIALYRLIHSLQKRFDAEGGRLVHHYSPLELDPTLYFEYFSAENYSISYPANSKEPVTITCKGTFRGDFWVQSMEEEVYLARRTNRRAKTPSDPFLFETLPRWGGGILFLLILVSFALVPHWQLRRVECGKPHGAVSLIVFLAGASLFVVGAPLSFKIVLERLFESRALTLVVPLGYIAMEVSGRLYSGEHMRQMTANMLTVAAATLVVTSELEMGYWHGGPERASVLGLLLLAALGLVAIRFARANAHPARTGP